MKHNKTILFLSLVLSVILMSSCQTIGKAGQALQSEPELSTSFSSINDTYYINTTIIFSADINSSAFIIENILPEGASLCSDIAIILNDNPQLQTEHFIKSFQINVFSILVKTDSNSLSNLNKFSLSFDLCNIENTGLLNQTINYVKSGSVYTKVYSIDLETQESEEQPAEEIPVEEITPEQEKLLELMPNPGILDLIVKYDYGYIWNIEINGCGNTYNYVGTKDDIFIRFEDVLEQCNPCDKNNIITIKVDGLPGSDTKYIKCSDIKKKLDNGDDYSYSFRPIYKNRYSKDEQNIIKNIKKQTVDCIISEKNGLLIQNPMCGIIYKTIDKPVQGSPYIAVLKRGDRINLPAGEYEVVFQADDYPRIKESFTVSDKKSTYFSARLDKDIIPEEELPEIKTEYMSSPEIIPENPKDGYVILLITTKDTEGVEWTISVDDKIYTGIKNPLILDYHDICDSTSDNIIIDVKSSKTQDYNKEFKCSSIKPKGKNKVVKLTPISN